MFVLFLFAFLALFASSESGKKQCPENEEFRRSYNPCTTCLSPYSCFNVDYGPGCDCEEGYVREKFCGPCIPVENCPSVCSKNEAYMECGPVSESCGSQNLLFKYDPKCYCNDGYQRNDNGVCIPSRDCLQTHDCQENEEYRMCGRIFELCGNFSDIIITCEHKCYCKPGYRRNCYGKCVEKDKCPQEFCPKNQKYYDCIPTYNHTCKGYNTGVIYSNQCKSGCFCKKGFVMNMNEECVNPGNCSDKVVSPNTTEDGNLSADQSSSSAASSSALSSSSESSSSVASSSSESKTASSGASGNAIFWATDGESSSNIPSTNTETSSSKVVTYDTSNNKNKNRIKSDKGLKSILKSILPKSFAVQFQKNKDTKDKPEAPDSSEMIYSSTSSAGISTSVSESDGSKKEISDFHKSKNSINTISNASSSSDNNKDPILSDSNTNANSESLSSSTSSTENVSKSTSDIEYPSSTESINPDNRSSDENS